jgi:hypothetical protein
MRELGFNTTAPKRAITGRSKEGEVGSDKSKSKSIARYEIVWTGFADFCFLIGNNESAMLPSRAHCPDDPIPLKLRMAILYMQFRVNKKGSPIKDIKTGKLVKMLTNELCIAWVTGRVSQQLESFGKQ